MTPLLARPRQAPPRSRGEVRPTPRQRKGGKWTSRSASIGSRESDTAVALAALLGARFSIDTTGDDRIDAGEVAIETVTLRPSSPAVGRPMTEISLAGDSEAAVLAVIRDDTPDLIEDDEGRCCQPGDRVVIAARRDRLSAVVDQLAG